MNHTHFNLTQVNHSRRGIAATEFALALPVLIVMLLGALDLTRFMLFHQKIERISYSTADVVSQAQSITANDLNNILKAASQIMLPAPFTTQGVVIISSVYKPVGQPTVIRWQYKGGGTLNRNSKVGVTNGAPTMPGGLILNDRDNVIVAETYYTFTPMFAGSAVPAQEIYRTALFKPRLGALTTPP
jgi:Flp pilus assembly protein TadG